MFPPISPNDLATLINEAAVAARRLHRKLVLPAADLDDIRQDLLADLICRLPGFDARRGSIGAFANIVLRNQSSRIAIRHHRLRRAQCGTMLSLDAPIAGGTEPLGCLLAEADGLAAWHGQDLSAAEDADLRHDLARALGDLPEDARKRAATRAHSWGLGRATIMAAMLNALAILIGVVWVIWEASQRFQSPVEMPGLTILIVAPVGIGVNTGSALLFVRAQKDDLNAKGAFLHMAADAAVSGAVILAAAGILLTGWTWLDPAVAIAVSLLIAITAAGLFRKALHLSLDGVPDRVDQAEGAAWLARQESVRDVHDLHIWPLSTTRTALAVHVVSKAQDTDVVLHDLAEGLGHGFGIAHSTIQVEREPCGASCLRAHA